MEEIITKLSRRIKTSIYRGSTRISSDTAAKIAAFIRYKLDKNGSASIYTDYCLCDSPYLVSEQQFSPLAKAFTPDHVVYNGAYSLFIHKKETIEEQLLEVESRIDSYVTEHNVLPKIIAVQNTAVFICCTTRRDAENARLVFEDAVKIAGYTESFGGYRNLSAEMLRFIAGWEVESYRTRVSSEKRENKRLQGRIAIVTGGAQGFGKGIAMGLAEHGAYLVIADLNEDGARETATEICEKYGEHRAISVKADVSNEDSICNLVTQTVEYYGGIDIMISNAGILRSGALDELSLADFERMTKVNYTAFFLCAKYAAQYMRIQRQASPDAMFDIVQINSKSGLAGSLRNFAYAGGKFGGIGLVQSFALELAEYGIKVNAICPGNYFDGPLWSDPERGLFVQYLKSGKVPGAKTIADVRRAYEDKAPMRRGCMPADVVTAIIYAVEQRFETGQAIPVTGGQIMLK